MANKISTNITSDLAIEILKEAITTHKPSAGLIPHSSLGGLHLLKRGICKINPTKCYNFA